MTRTTATLEFSPETVLEAAKTKLAQALLQLRADSVPDAELAEVQTLVFEAGELLDNVALFRRAGARTSGTPTP